MDVGHIRPMLRRIRLSELNPQIIDEMVEISENVGFEQTIRYDDNAEFLLKIYEKAKLSKDKKALRQAEDMIMRIGAISTRQTGYSGKMKNNKTSKKPPKKPCFDTGSDIIKIPLSKEIINTFHSIGIKNKAMMKIAVGLLGEEKIKDYAEYLLASDLGEETVKSYMNKCPEAILQPNEDVFVHDIGILEKKKEIFDMCIERGKLPESLDYRQRPAILSLAGKTIRDELSIEAKKIQQDEAKKEKAQKIPTIGTKEFIRIMTTKFGFVEEKRVTHGTFFVNEETSARIMIQNPHKGQLYMEPSIIREKLRAAGITEKEFMESR